MEEISQRYCTVDDKDSPVFLLETVGVASDWVVGYQPFVHGKNDTAASSCGFSTDINTLPRGCGVV